MNVFGQRIQTGAAAATTTHTHHHDDFRFSLSYPITSIHPIHAPVRVLEGADHGRRPQEVDDLRDEDARGGGRGQEGVVHAVGELAPLFCLGDLGGWLRVIWVVGGIGFGWGGMPVVVGLFIHLELELAGGDGGGRGACPVIGWDGGVACL